MSEQFINPNQANQMLGQNDQGSPSAFRVTEAQADLIGGGFDPMRQMRETFLASQHQQQASIPPTVPAPSNLPPTYPQYPGSQPGYNPAAAQNQNQNFNNGSNANPGQNNMDYNQMARNALARMRTQIAPANNVQNQGANPQNVNQGGYPNQPGYQNAPPANPQGQSWQQKIAGLDPADQQRISQGVAAIDSMSSQAQRFRQLAAERGYNPVEYENELKQVTPERMIEWITRDRAARQAQQNYIPGASVTNISDANSQGNPNNATGPMQRKWRP